jgi:hypothetical protein
MAAMSSGGRIVRHKGVVPSCCLKPLYGTVTMPVAFASSSQQPCPPQAAHAAYFFMKAA